MADGRRQRTIVVRKDWKTRLMTWTCSVRNDPLVQWSEFGTNRLPPRVLTCHGRRFETARDHCFCPLQQGMYSQRRMLIMVHEGVRRGGYVCVYVMREGGENGCLSDYIIFDSMKKCFHRSFTFASLIRGTQIIFVPSSRRWQSLLISTRLFWRKELL